MALAHVIGDGTVASYRRGDDLFEKRRRLMTDWARFCAFSVIAASSARGLRGQLYGRPAGSAAPAKSSRVAPRVRAAADREAEDAALDCFDRRMRTHRTSREPGDTDSWLGVIRTKSSRI
jgi:hypothetical protein